MKVNKLAAIAFIATVAVSQSAIAQEVEESSNAADATAVAAARGENRAIADGTGPVADLRAARSAAADARANGDAGREIAAAARENATVARENAAAIREQATAIRDIASTSRGDAAAIRAQVSAIRDVVAAGRPGR